jgi:hypothetical protein
MSLGFDHLILKDSAEEKRVGYATAADLLMTKALNGRGSFDLRIPAQGDKKSGLAGVTLVSTPNPVSQVLW